MPNYDVECPTCGTYERFKKIADRRDPCDKCGSLVDVLITASHKTTGFEPYFDYGLGIEVTGQGDINKMKREHNLYDKDPPSKGEVSARRDRINEKRKREFATAR